MNVYETLLEQTRLSPQAVALIDSKPEKEKITYIELLRLTECCAERLEKKGLRAGDVVLLFEPMSVRLYVVLLALFKLGMVAMFVDPAAGWQAVTSACSLGRPRAVITGGVKALSYCLLHPALRAIGMRISIAGVCRLSRAKFMSDPDLTAETESTFAADPSTPALLTFTSGTTGEAKGICRTHGFLTEQGATLKQALELKAGTIQLVSLPMFVLANLGSQVTSVIPNCDVRSPGRANTKVLRKQIEQHNVQEIVASPALVERLASCAVSVGKPLTGIKRVLTGGGPVLPRLHRLVGCAMRNACLKAVYGSTEAEPIAQCNFDAISEGDMLSMRSGSGLLAGRIDSGVNLRIISRQWHSPVCSSEAFEQGSLPSGQIGEIVVSGKHVVRGYLNAEQDLKNKINVAGTIWHRTGDAGYLDGEGRLWLLGRCAQIIHDERGDLYPFALEVEALEMAEACHAAVILFSGQRTLVVESGPNTSRAMIETIANKADIERVIFVNRIPLDSRHNSKIDYCALLRKLTADRSLLA